MPNSIPHSENPESTMTPREAELLRAAALERRDRHANGHRQSMVVELALYTGAKVAELSELRMDDVRLVPGDETLRIRSSNHPRVLPIYGRMLTRFVEYIQWKQGAGESMSPEAPFVCSQRGGPLSLRGWQDAWCLAQQHAGLADGDGRAVYSLESAREYVGRVIYKVRNNPHDVQTWLGIQMQTNVDRYRPEELCFAPVQLRPLLDAPDVVGNRPWHSSTSVEVLVAVGLYNGTSGMMDRHNARRQFLRAPNSDPMGQLWIARCLDHGRSFFPINQEMAQQKASMVMGRIRELSEQGDTMAMYLLAAALEDGLGCEMDYDESLLWYHRAAENGYETAWNNLGLMVENARGVERDSAVSVEYFRRGATMHEGSSMFNLAVMLGEGIGCEKNMEEAIHWYGKAASIGEPRSMNNLSYIYYHGVGGVPQSAHLAEYWYCLAGQLPFSPTGYVRPRPQLAMIRAAG